MQPNDKTYTKHLYNVMDITVDRFVEFLKVVDTLKVEVCFVKFKSFWKILCNLNYIKWNVDSR